VLLRLKLEKINGIVQYKLTQENTNTFDLQIVKGQNFDEAKREEFENMLREILGRDTLIRVNMVGEISRENSGKIRPIVSKVPVKFRGK